MEIAWSASLLVLLFLVSSSLLPSPSSAICVPRNSNSTASASAPAPAFSPAPLPSAAAAPALPPQPSSGGGFFPFPLGPASSALKQICDKTEHSAECVASVSPFLSGQVDAVSVLNAELQALHKAFKEGLDLAQTLYYGATREVRGCLDVCMDVYESGASDLTDALAAILNHDVGKLNAVLSAAVSYPDTCEDAFEEWDIQNPLTETDELLGTLASNGLAIAELLPWN